MRRPGYDIDVEKVVRACAKHAVAVEINANPWRLDLDWRWHQCFKSNEHVAPTGRRHRLFYQCKSVNSTWPLKLIALHGVSPSTHRCSADDLDNLRVRKSL
jgi:hypothetical protein